MNFTQNILDKTFGILPNNWTIFRIKDLFEIGRGRVIAASEVEKEQTEINNYPVYSAATENNGIIGYINTFDFNQPLLTWTTDGVNAGTVFIRDGKFNCTNVCGTLVAKNKQKNLKFYKYALEAQTPHYKRADINGAKIMNNEMAAILIAEPSSEEDQNKIVTFLDTETSKIERKISILEQKYEKLEEYKQSVIFETVTKGLDSNVEMKDSGIDWIGEIPKHWEVVRLKSIYNYKNGYAFSDNDYSKEPNGNYLIKITNVTENGIQEDETFCIEVNETTKKFKIKEDSILYALSGATAGKCCFLDTTEKNFYLNQRVAQMQLKNGINKYFYYLICNKVFANLLLTLYPQTAQPNIGKNDLDNSYVPFVSNLIEQKEIVEYLDHFISKIDKKKEIIKKQIELLKEYKQTIIYEAVTGKMEIL